MRHELIERRAPAIVKSHVGVFFAAVLVFVHHQRRVLGSLSLCLKRDKCRKDEPSTRGGIGLLTGRTEARLQRIGPAQPFVPGDFEIAPQVRILLPFRRTHYLSLIHISEPTRLLSISYAVFCLKK